MMDPIAVSVNNTPIPVHIQHPLVHPVWNHGKNSQARRQLCLAVAGDEERALQLELDEARKSRKMEV